MKFHCEDLAEAGVVLIPRDSHAFQPLCADIRRHLENPPPGSPPPFPGETPDLPNGYEPASAILWNQSGKPICAFTLIWKYDWKDQWGDDRTTTSTHVNGVGHTPSLLLPFGLTEDRRAFATYWQTILPHSKRYLDGGRILGANADVRQPAPNEQWKGGVMRWGTGQREHNDHADTVTLTLDAVFFSTGECAGPDTKQLWNRTIAAAEMYQEVVAVVRGCVDAASDGEQILAAVERLTGDAARPLPPPGPPPSHGPAKPGAFREYERCCLAKRIAHMRTQFGHDKTVSILRDWADTAVPHYRRV